MMNIYYQMNWLYLSMVVGEGGWCVNYDHADLRNAEFPPNRPRHEWESWCLLDMYGIEELE